jgi:hypothetical protein
MIPLLLLPDRLNGRPLLGLMIASAAVLAAAIAAEVSIGLAQLAGIAAVSLAGCAGVIVWARPMQPHDAIRGLMPVYAALVGGSAFSAAVYPDPPITWLAALPLLPLVIWLAPIILRKSLQPDGK